MNTTKTITITIHMTTNANIHITIMYTTTATTTTNNDNDNSNHDNTIYDDNNDYNRRHPLGQGSGQVREDEHRRHELHRHERGSDDITKLNLIYI